MKLQFFGHACFMVHLNGKKILFDPFITPNEKAKNVVKINDLHPDYVLITHGHQDHVADALEILKNTGAKLVTNFEIGFWYQQQGIENVHQMNHGGAWNFDFGRVKYTPAIHSSMLPDGSNGGDPGGFVVQSDAFTFYFAGDTALTYDMKLIGEEFDLDLAILPVGDNFTMGPDDAVKASDFVNCNKVLGVHFDTFGYIEIDHDEARGKFKKAGKELILPKPGDSFEF
jgi:L-ascorbate metabolism protein UlaG (beta-lactamase superfamily)